MAVSALTVEQLSQLISKTVKEEMASSTRNQTPPQPSPNTQPHYTPNTQPHYTPNTQPHYTTSTPHHMQRNNYGSSQRTYHQNGHDAGQSCTHTRQYNPTYSATPRTTGTSPQQYYNRRPHGPTMQQIRIMVTYVETACTLWGQVLTPDLIDVHKKLEDDLSEICPLLPATQMVSKSSIYGTLWDDTWYRCISCCVPDPHGNVEVLFVDFGNKERRNLSELVYLKTPKLCDVPFLACPLQFQHMIAVPEKQLDAIAHFNTTDILTGIVTRTPTSKEYTDITLIRPLTSTSEHPQETTYNALMLELGYAKKSDSIVDTKPPQPHYYVQGLNDRLRKLVGTIREKDAQVQKLCQMLEESTGQEVDITQIEVNVQNSLCPTVPRTPTRYRTSLMGPSTVNAVPVPAAPVPDTPEALTPDTYTSLTQTDLEIPEKDEPIESQLQAYLDDLFVQLERYSKYDEAEGKTGDGIQSHHERLVACILPPEVVSLKATVDTALAELATSRTRILACSEPKALEDAVAQRDETLRLISDHIVAYLAKLAEVELPELHAKVGQILVELGSSKVALKPSTPALEDTLQELQDLEKAHSEELGALHGECSEQLSFLKEQFGSCSNIISTCSARVGADDTEPGETLQTLLADVHKIKSERENVNALGANIATTKALLADIAETISRNKSQRTPLLDRLQAQMVGRAERTHQEIAPYIDCCDDLDYRAKLAVETLANKPDMDALKEVKAQLKAAKRAVKLARIKDEDSEEEPHIRECMLKLHALYEGEEGELSKLANLARTTHPELLVEHPQLSNMTSAKNRMIKCGWELNEFVLPDTVASINTAGHHVYEGFYGEKDVFLVERILKSISDSLEEQALDLLAGQLAGCFAIFIDRQRLRAFGATEEPPI